MLENISSYSSSLFQVLVTNLDVETVTHYEPANFWIGPSAVSSTIQLHNTVFIFSITIILTGAHSVHRFSSELKGRRQSVLAFAMTFQTFEMIFGY